MTIACGGTGGHLYPGCAVAEELKTRGCAVMLMVSPKEVDQQATRNLEGMEVVTLPATGLSWSHPGTFFKGFWESFRIGCHLFRERTPHAVLAMGGFTSAAPVLAGRRVGSLVFLHESNTIPGRANRWLSRLADQAFVGFPQAASLLKTRAVEVTGTPVRAEFHPASASSARIAIGLDARRPVLLVMGGSQGASGINEIVLRSLGLLKLSLPEMQYLHLTGPKDVELVQKAYRAENLRAVVRPFLTEMELAMDAATVAVSRAGASTMAELAAMGLPSILIPYPFAADNHQFYNARAYVESGAARMLVQKQAVPELFVQMVTDLVRSQSRREDMCNSLASWHKPAVAEHIAKSILRRTIAAAAPKSAREQADCPPSASPCCAGPLNFKSESPNLKS